MATKARRAAGAVMSRVMIGSVLSRRLSTSTIGLWAPSLLFSALPPPSPLASVLRRARVEAKGEEALTRTRACPHCSSLSPRGHPLHQETRPGAASRGTGRLAPPAGAAAVLGSPRRCARCPNRSPRSRQLLQLTRERPGSCGPGEGDPMAITDRPGRHRQALAQQTKVRRAPPLPRQKWRFQLVRPPNVLP